MWSHAHLICDTCRTQCTSILHNEWRHPDVPDLQQLQKSAQQAPLLAAGVQAADLQHVGYAAVAQGLQQHRRQQQVSHCCCPSAPGEPVRQLPLRECNALIEFVPMIIRTTKAMSDA